MSRRVSERFPGSVGRRWTPLPEELFEHGRTLGLDAADIAIIAAMESLRRERGQVVRSSEATLARRACVGRATLQRRLSRMDRDGAPTGLAALVRVVPGGRGADGKQTANGYDLAPLWDALAGCVEAGHRASPRGADGASDRGADRASKRAATVPHSGQEPCLILRQELLEEETEEEQTHRARDFARSILALFNGAAGTSYDGEQWLDLIAARVAEHPGLTLDDHRAVIDAAFRRPWWQGIPSPRVIFTSAQFEQARQAATKPRRYIGVRDDDDAPLVSASANGRSSRYTRED